MKVSVRMNADLILNDENTSLKNLKNIELAFHFREPFFNTDLDELIERVKDLGLNVNSIHGPAVRLYRESELKAAIEICITLCKAFNCKYIVIHPSPVNHRYDAIDFIKQEITSLLSESDTVIAWENFPGTKRIVNSVSEIADFVENELEDPEHHGICLDTSHAQKKTSKLIRIMQKYKELIRVYHISNWASKEQHLPLFHPHGKIDFYKVLSKSNFNQNSTVTLEYMSEFFHKLQEDYSIVATKLLNI